MEGEDGWVVERERERGGGGGGEGMREEHSRLQAITLRVSLKVSHMSCRERGAWCHFASHVTQFYMTSSLHHRGSRCNWTSW